MTKKKLYWIALFCQLMALVALVGCSSPQTVSPGLPAPATQARPAGDAYSTAMPPAFAGKQITTGGRCYIDSFNGKIVGPRNEFLRSELITVDGWAISQQGTADPQVAVELTSMDGSRRYYAPAQRSTRPGLGKALGNPALDRAALQSTASVQTLVPGDYSVSVLFGNEAAVSRCTPNVSLLLK